MLEPEDLLQEVSKLSKEFYAAHEQKSIIERFNVFKIEVKIWASDLNNQCKDYYDEAKKYDADAKIFYLTPSGKLLSPESSDGVPAESMKCISFENDIYDWVSYCISQPEVIRNLPLREVLLQIAATIKRQSKNLLNRLILEQHYRQDYLRR